MLDINSRSPATHPIVLKMSQIHKILLVSLMVVNAGILASPQQNCAFEVNPKDSSAKRNDNVELRCQPSNNQDFIVWEVFLDNGTYWTVSGSDAARQLQRGYEFIPVSGVLRIIKVQDYHAGNYRCKATKYIDGACIYYSDNATLTVQNEDTNASVQKCEYEISPNDTTVTINDVNVELHCQTSSNLDFSIWEIFLENGTYWTVSASDPEQQLSRGFMYVPDTRALRITKVQNFHAGTYRCLATKIFGGGCIYHSDNATLTVKDPLPPMPVDVQSFCSHIVWRNPPNASHSFDHITGYDVKLADPDTKQEAIRRVDSSGTFYSLRQMDDAFLKKDTTVIQVRVVKNGIPGEFSSPMPLGCHGQLLNPEEINRIYSTDTASHSTDIPTGVYRCEIPTSNGNNQKLYISLITGASDSS